MAFRKKGNDKVGGLDAAEICRREEKAFAFTSFEREKYALAAAYVEGRQWVAPRRGGAELVEVDMDRFDGEGFQKVTDNQLGKELEKQAGRLLTSLAWEVPAQSPDAAARQAAHIAETVLRHTAHEHRWEELDFDMWYAARLGGCSALYLLWDPSANGFGVDDAGNEIGTGDIVCGVADIGEFAVEPGGHHPSKAHWWVLRRALPRAAVQEMYNLPELPPADATEFGIVSTPGSSLSGAELTKVVTLFERPHGKHKGGVWTVVGGEIVEHTPWPFPFDDELNLEVYRPWPRRRRWTGRTSVWDALSDQTLINLWESYKLAYARDAATAPWVVDGAFADEMPAVPGDTIRYTPDPMGGQPPHRVPPPPLPPAVEKVTEEARGRLVDKVGSAEVLSGDAPKGVTAASALAALIEMANASVSHMVRERARVWGRFASKVLKLYEVKVTDNQPRREAKIHVAGLPALPLQVVTRDAQGNERIETGWRGSDLLGHTEAVVPVGRIMPRNKAASQALADSLLERGLIDPKDARAYVAVADVPADEDWLEALPGHADWARAERENWMLAVGRACVVEPFDDDPVHLQSHLTFAKSARWELLSAEAKRLFLEHLQQHETQAAEKAGRKMAQHEASPALAAAPTVANVAPDVMEAVTGRAPAAAPPAAAPPAAPAGMPPVPQGPPPGVPGAPGPLPEDPMPGPSTPAGPLGPAL